MNTLNAKLISVEKGQVKISCEFSENLTQQHLVEHWDVLQEEVPAENTASKNPMFPINP